MKEYIVFVFLLTVAIGTAGCKTSAPSSLTIKNATSDAISSLKITVCGQSETFEKLAADESAEMSFNSKHDSSYEVDIVFDSGEALKEKAGYVTNGFCYSDTLVIQRDTVKVISRPGDCK